MTQQEVLEKYIEFFKKNGHKVIPNFPLVLENDPTTLFTSSGMQPLIPYLLGETHPQGDRLVDVQNCLRSQDIEEVGDNRHTTFFRMLGNWSLGSYFKKEEIPWFWEFLTSELGLPKERLYVTVFEGYKDVPKDEETYGIWKGIFEKEGMNPDERIYFYSTKNWWSRSGGPDTMPAGEPGGPDTEVFYQFDIEHDPAFGETCHPNCDCGRFMEIGNAVFMQYQKQEDGSFKELPKMNVDFGGGMERLLAASANDPDVFNTESYKEVIETIEKLTGKSYQDKEAQTQMRVIADHLKAAVFLIVAGVVPANKEHGYVLRRLLRRSAVKMHSLTGGATSNVSFEDIADTILKIEERWQVENLNHINRDKQKDQVFSVIKDEMKKFGQSLDRGLKKINSWSEGEWNPLNAFDLYQSHGFPFEITEEIFKQHGKALNRKEFDGAFEAHKNLSRTASAGKFKGGLADHEDMTIKGHTATHLLQQAIRDVLGDQVHQTGSNITTERLRFDFNYDKALTEEELKKVEAIVTDKIKENLPVFFKIMPLAEAKNLGAIGLFDEKYEQDVKVYFIGGAPDSPATAYSKEFCGGPHVDFTSRLETFTITKEESLGAGQRRIYAVVGKN